MTSVLNVDSIAAKDGTSPVELTKQVAAKAWVYSVVSGGTPALTDSFNVSTITDVGPGDYKFNLASAMNNATFATSITPQYSTSSGSNAFFHQEDGSDKATTSFGLDHFQNGTKADPTRESGIVFGDLA